MIRRQAGIMAHAHTDIQTKRKERQDSKKSNEQKDRTLKRVMSRKTGL